MLKSVYGFLFSNREQEKRPVPTVDQIFSGIDVKKTPEPVPKITNTEVIPPVEPIESTVESTLVWSISERKWVAEVASTSQELDTGTEVVKEEPPETPEIVESTPVKEPESAIVKSIQTVQEFKKEMTEHIIVQKQKHEEKLRQQELAKLERPKRVLKQWVPNDALVKAHDVAAEAVGKVPNLLKKVKQHQDKITTKQNEIEKIQNKKDLNPYDRFELIDYKKDILTEQGKISDIELQLGQAQCYIDDPIFEEFVLYLVEAEEYIKEAELTGIMNVNDILTSESIYIKTKSLMDSLKYGKKNPILMERLQFISQSFNMGDIHENSRGKNLREFSSFFIGDKINSPLYLFDKMDAQAIGESTTMKTITGGEAGGMLDQSLISDIASSRNEQKESETKSESSLESSLESSAF